MKVDRDTVRKIAHLARLEFDANAEEQIIKDMSEILDWVEQLNEVDTTDVEPLTNMSLEVNSFREDQVREHLSHESGLNNAPKRDQDYFRVPKVLE